MKKSITVAAVIIAFILLFQTAQAKILRVGYFGTPVTGVDYTSLQPALDAAARGDTIQLYPGTWGGTYGADISKRVVILSKGYFTEGSGSNPNLQVINGDVNVIRLNMHTGSDSSVIEGLSGGTIYAVNGIVNSVKIRRCWLNNIIFGNQTYNNWRVEQCFIDNSIYFTNSLPGGLVTNFNVINSYIANINFGWGASSGISGQLSNNVLGNTSYNFRNGTFLILSNIFIGTTTSFAGTINCDFQSNLAEGTTVLPTGNGNKNGVNMTNTFVGYPTQGSYSNDGRYKLKNPGPGIGTGYGGVDCGMFGGPNPYYLSGIPSVPSFYKLTSTSVNTSSNPYTITFSVRSNN